MRLLAAAVLLLGWSVAAPLQVSVSSGPRLKGSQLTFSGSTTVTAKRGQQVVWQQKIYSPLIGAKDWGVTDSVVWLTVIRGEVSWHADSVGLRLRDGKKLWDITSVSAPLYASRQVLVFKWTDVTTAWPDLHHPQVIVVQVATGQKRELNFTIPERYNCEGINEKSYEAGSVLRFKADAQYFYAYMTDACGVFMARFDWHGSANQKPVVKAI